MNVSAERDAVIELLRKFSIDAEDIKRVLGTERISEYAGTVQEAVAKLVQDAIATTRVPLMEEGAEIKLFLVMLDTPIEVVSDSVNGLIGGCLDAASALLAVHTLPINTFITSQQPHEPDTSVTEAAPPMTVVPPVVRGAPPVGVPPAPMGGPPVGPPPPSNPNQQDGEDGAIRQGVGKLHSIVVDEKGHAKFMVGTFKWAFTDARGPEVVATLFDPELGWKPEHFFPGAFYSAENCGNLHVMWEKPGKYYNITRIFNKL